MARGRRFRRPLRRRTRPSHREHRSVLIPWFEWAWPTLAMRPTKCAAQGGSVIANLGFCSSVTLFGCGRRRRGCGDFADANGPRELVEVLRALVGVGDAEVNHGLIELVAVAEISGNSTRVARASMSFGNEFTTN